ncbi:MAG TPA: 3-oxoacid CoA-transferase subunit A [Ramlibacter sp.]|nr:3-oxoacid CoA-transferase subunit A [Ramlibacter sp.]
MINKQVRNVAEAVQGVRDGAVVFVGGFGPSGRPEQLVLGLLELGVRNLTIVANNATAGNDSVAELMSAGRVRKVVCSFPRGLMGRTIFEDLYRAGKIELELVPQGTLAERIRAGAAGIGGFFTRTAAGTELAKGKETREIDGELYVLEKPIRGDVALVRGEVGDRWGNLTYHRGARFNNPIIAGAAPLCVAQVAKLVEPGGIDPEVVITPSVFVHRIVEVPA